MKNTDLVFRGSSDVIVKEELEKLLLADKPLRIKFGIDPTAGRIHIGRAATIRHLKHFQDLGHEVHIIIGSFTGQIGDSSDKDAERKMLTREEIEANMKDYDKQLSRIFDTSKMTVHYNGDWFAKMDLAEFFRLQQMFSVAQMIERENFALRYKEGNRIGLHEFSYALLQGYDSVAMKADIEIGGTDQLFNLLAGRTIQKNYDLKQQHVVTYELLLGLDGRKMSTTWGNCIYVDDEPNDMFGKVMSIGDELMWDYYRLVTEIPQTQLQAVKKKIEAGENPRQLKSDLAWEITKLYYDERTADKARDEFDSTFKDKSLPTGMTEAKTALGERKLVDLLVELTLVGSKSEAKRMVEQGAVKLNQRAIAKDEEMIKISAGDVVQVGKRRFTRVLG